MVKLVFFCLTAGAEALPGCAALLFGCKNTTFISIRKGLREIFLIFFSNNEKAPPKEGALSSEYEANNLLLRKDHDSVPVVGGVGLHV